MTAFPATGQSRTGRVGVDFGTSNSAVAYPATGGELEFATFSLLGKPTHSYRSLLFFDPEEQEVRLPLQFHAGTEAVEAYLEALGEGRLVQSFKTHLTSESLGRTQIGHHSVSLDDMLALFFVRLRKHIESAQGHAVHRAMFGRPVRFAGARSEDDHERAEQRLREAATTAGFEEIGFELEPIAAAFHYERTLTTPELALVADFGGGTTDFCLMQLGPDRHQRANRSSDIVGTGGVGVAGDDLDATIIERLVCPVLGQGSTYVEMGREKAIPNSYYYKLARWHQLSFLRGKRIRAELDRLHRHARNPDALESLIHIIEHNQGFHLHKAVEQLKVDLSSQPQATFSYTDGPIRIEQSVERETFEGWIAPHVAAIDDALAATLDRASASTGDVDRVFMTGGTAFVPAVRRAFARRFGADKLVGGGELISIASGLAMAASRVWPGE